MIKAHTSHVDLLERRSQTTGKQALQEELSGQDSQDSAQMAQRMECCDEEKREALVQDLKAQIETGHYHVDSILLAQRMQELLTSHAEADWE